MRDYYLLIDGQQVGPYTAEQLHEMLAKGELTSESPAWYDGLADWAQLGSILEEIVPPQVAPAPVKRVITAPITPAAAPAVAVTSIPYTGVVQTNVKQGALLGGLVCFFLGMGFMFFSLFSFIFYGPLFFVALILSVVAMAQGRVAGGVILLLVSLVVPTIVGVVLFTERASAALASIAPPTSTHTDAPVAVADSSTTPPTATPTADITSAPSTTTAPPASATTTSPVVMPAPPASKHPALDSKLGFRTYKLGTPFSQFNPDDLDVESFYQKSDTKPYGVKTFDKQLGAAEIDSIQLNFLQDLLQSIRVTVKGKQSSLALKEALITAYGQPDDTSQMMGETDTWNGDDCVLVFRIDVIGEGSTAIFSSNSVDSKIKTITEQKAKAGAAAGAQNL